MPSGPAILAALALLASSIFGASSLMTVQVPKRPAARLPINLIRLPLTRQATCYTCGASALQSILAYYGHDYNEDELARKLKSNFQQGTAYKRIYDYAQKLGFKAEIYKEMTLVQLKEKIDKKLPVICLIQAWSEHPKNYRDDWADGHYVVAVGYDERNIFFMDPSTLGNYTYIPEGEFLERWHDTDGKEKLKHFGMSVWQDEATYSADLAKFME